MSIDIACKDTICALATVPGMSALSIVRVSGHKSLEIFNKVFVPHHKKAHPFVMTHGSIKDGQEVIDDVMAVCFIDKKSFTGESSFEINCHGNPLIVKQILQLLCNSGARLARAGEFTMRAVLNNKLDLSQAESIADLIHATSDEARQCALMGVRGGLAQKTLAVQKNIVAILAEVEARMDFPEEDLGSYDHELMAQKINTALSELQKILASADYGIKLHQGIKIVLCGKPNAGKSTLLNMLCGQEKAIVHHHAGTTRDVIEADIDLGGINAKLLDVAGIRTVSNDSAVEKIGIDRAFDQVNEADLIIWLADATKSNPFDDQEISAAINQLDTPVLKVLNKKDLLSEEQSHQAFTISAKEGHGIQALRAHMKEMITGPKINTNEIFIGRARQKDELVEAVDALRHAHKALSLKLADEVVTSELRKAGSAFERLFGQDLSEAVLDTIFSQFCIGK